MTALSRQIGGSHYKLPIQPVEFIRANRYDFFAGNIFKYVVRWREKGGVADLEKAVHYAELRRDLRIARPFHRVSRWTGAFIDAVWRWSENYPKNLREISVGEFIIANHIGEADRRVLYALDGWVRGEYEAVWFIHVLKEYALTMRHFTR